MIKDIVTIVVTFLLVSLSFFIYAKLSRFGMESVYKAWDGHSYVIAAESL